MLQVDFAISLLISVSG